MSRVINGQIVTERMLRVHSKGVSPSEKTTIKVAFFFKEKNLLLNCEIDAKRGESALSAISRLDGVILGTHATFGRAMTGFDKLFMEGPALPGGYEYYAEQADKNYAKQVSSDQSLTGMGLEFQIMRNGKSGMPYVEKNGQKVFLSLDQISAENNLEIAVTITERKPPAPSQAVFEHDVRLKFKLPEKFTQTIFGKFSIDTALNGEFDQIFAVLRATRRLAASQISFSIVKIAKAAEFGIGLFDYRKFGAQKVAPLFDFNHKRRLDLESEMLPSKSQNRQSVAFRAISFALPASSLTAQKWQALGEEESDYCSVSHGGFFSRHPLPDFNFTPAAIFLPSQSETSHASMANGIFNSDNIAASFSKFGERNPNPGVISKPISNSNQMAVSAHNQTAVPNSRITSRVRAIIFDMDGVLANSEPLHLKSFRQVFAPYGVKITEKEWYSKYIGTGSRHIVSDLCARYNIKADQTALLETRKALFQQYVDKGMLKAVPGALETVKLAKKNGIKTIVASGGHRQNVDAQLASLGLDMKSVCLEDVANRKPHPEAFLKASELIGVPPAQCLVIEDSPAGVLAAERAGMRVLLVAKQPNPKLKAMATKAAASMKSKSITNWLLGLFSGEKKDSKKKKPAALRSRVVAYTPPRKK